MSYVPKPGPHQLGSILRIRSGEETLEMCGIGFDLNSVLKKVNWCGQMHYFCRLHWFPKFEDANARHPSLAALRSIKQNPFFAFVGDSCGVSAAAVGFSSVRQPETRCD
jgi:hypothetical protein